MKTYCKIVAISDRNVNVNNFQGNETGLHDAAKCVKIIATKKKTK